MCYTLIDTLQLDQGRASAGELSVLALPHII